MNVSAPVATTNVRASVQDIEGRLRDVVETLDSIRRSVNGPEPTAEGDKEARFDSLMSDLGSLGQTLRRLEGLSQHLREIIG